MDETKRRTQKRFSVLGLRSLDWSQCGDVGDDFVNENSSALRKSGRWRSIFDRQSEKFKHCKLVNDYFSKVKGFKIMKLIRQRLNESFRLIRLWNTILLISYYIHNFKVWVFALMHNLKDPNILYFKVQHIFYCSQCSKI